MSFETAAILTSWLANLVLALAVAALYAKVSSLESGGPGAVAYAPATSAGESLAGRLVLFATEGCATCAGVLAETVRLRDAGLLPTDRIAVVLARGDLAAADADVETVVDPGLFERFGVVATPTVALVEGDGRIAAMSPVASVERYRDTVMEQFSPRR